ncbi:nuclear condensin complex subunit 3 [Blyttiomyces helicus]|uniref:Nuclear condensin complex subunit 3 n=1 Tax=Blyttiomyces helicus TaxID=388810 RepID=A0A4P9W1C7_9FUNG|nr:nuclear condensin complex subunit 3 [Blyttiomyces helicus]|eukprot:RKO84518.1 nuclear condensin complex subunit 3 [Blyttiomyces helicus]
MLKCLSIIRCVLQCTQEHLRDNTSVSGLLESFIYPGIRSPHPVLNSAALECLGLCCILDRNLASEQISVFHKALELAFNSSDEELTIIVLKILFDLAIWHGISRSPNHVHPVDVQDRSTSNIIIVPLLLFRMTETKADPETDLLASIATKYLDCTNEAILTLTAEGLVKLMMSGMMKNTEVNNAGDRIGE